MCVHLLCTLNVNMSFNIYNVLHILIGHISRAFAEALEH